MAESTQVVEKKPATKKRVTVTYNGRAKSFKFDPDQLVSALLQEALLAFRVVQNQHLFSLFDKAGIELADGVTLRTAGVRAGDRLVLRQSVVKGG